MSYCVWFTCRQHTCGWFSLQKRCSREFHIEKRPVWRTSKQNGQISFLESRALPLPSNSLALYLFCFLAPPFLLSVCQSRLQRSLSSLLKGDLVDMPWAKGNLFCTSSMHHVAVSVDSTTKNCETEAYIDLLQSAHSPCSSCYSHETQPRSSLVMRAFHIYGYWIPQADYPFGQFVVPLVLLGK